MLNGLEFIPKNKIGSLACPCCNTLGKVTANDIYDLVTDKIIHLIENEKDLAWQKTWVTKNSTGLAATNFVTKKPYRGINSFMLNMVYPMFLKRVFKSPYFLTFKQVEQLGGKVKKGSKGIEVFYYTFLFKNDGKSITESDFKALRQKCIAENNAEDCAELDKFAMIKYYNVFSADDVEGIDFSLPKSTTPTTINEKIEVCESIVSNFPSPQPPIVFKDPSGAFYSPGPDLVNMPDINSFKDAQAYYSTLFHELIHSTGSKKRLERDFSGKFGSKPYAFEELIAELGASYLNAESGILYFNLKNSAAYLKGWKSKLVDLLKEDNKFIMRAASAAQKATDFILQYDDEGVPLYQRNVTLPSNVVTPKHKTVTLANYSEQNFDTSKWPDVLKKGHAFILSTSEFYDADESIKQAIDNHIELVNKMLSQTFVAPKQSKQMAGTESAARVIIKKYLALHGKTVSRKTISKLFQELKGAVKAKKIRITDEWAKEIIRIQDNLASLLDSKDYSWKLHIAVHSKYQEKLNKGLGFIPFIIKAVASGIIQSKVDKALYPGQMKGLSGVPDSKEVPNKKPQAKEGENIKPADEKNEAAQANKLFTRADQKPEAINVPGTFALKGEMGKFLGKTQPFRYAIVLTGDPHAGKTQVLMQMLDAYADSNKDCAAFMLEQGGMESKDTQESITRNIKKSNLSKISIAGEAPNGIDTLKEYAKQFAVIAVDSWQKLNIPATRLDELRAEFPNTIWIVVFQQNADGGTRGGSASEYDANVLIKVVKVDKTFKNNYAELKKNRGNPETLMLKYMVATKKCKPLIEEKKEKIEPKKPKENVQ